MSKYFARQYDYPDKPILKGLVLVYPELPYALLAKLLRKKDVFVNGKRADEGATLHGGDQLDLFCAPDMIGLKVLYRDDNILALYKPKGVASDGDRSFETLAAYVFGDVRLLHRLDTNTDGVLLFALNDLAYDVMRKGMQDGSIIKFYRARVWGKMPLVNRTLHGYLFKDRVKGRVSISDSKVKGSVPVEAEVHPLGYEGNSTHVELVLHGGKTHQLRAQLAHDGHFILGDGKYGDDRINRKEGFGKQLLTAYGIKFDFREDKLGLNGVEITI